MWQKRLDAFKDLVIHGKSKPLGEISHYVQNSECQGRLSERVHFIFWRKKPLPKLLRWIAGNVLPIQSSLLIESDSLGT